MIAEDLLAPAPPLLPRICSATGPSWAAAEGSAAQARLFNTPPPTQGLASLAILGMFERLGVAAAEGFDHLHGLIEATKQAFLLRDRVATDRSSRPIRNRR